MRAAATTGPLRERRKLAAMRRAQEEAMRLLEARGFSSVSMEEVAAAADISPATLYRYFGTKENLVVWDEFDSPLAAGISARLRREPALRAIGSAVAEDLADMPQEQLQLLARRVRLIFAEPALLAAARANSRAMTALFAGLIAAAHGRSDASFEDRVRAAAAAAALEAAIEAWNGAGAAQPLEGFVRDAFAILSEAR